MKSKAFALFVACGFVAWGGPISNAATHGFVTSINAQATDAGLDALNHGGNAVDAAVASGLMLAVVDGNNSGIGGGCFILIHLANGKTVAIDGRETAPARATRDMYLRDGKAENKLSETGPLAVATPGALAAYENAITHFGRLPFKTPLLAAARVARDGFVMNASYIHRVASVASDLGKYDGARDIFLDPNGSPRKSGEVLVQADLARTLTNIAEKGTDYFYRGPTAREIGNWMGSNHGLLSADDFARYEIKLREPLITTYRGYTIIGFPPPSSGGVHVAQILNILENFDLKGMGEGSAEFIHTVAEAMKLAFADRAYWLGDPDFAPVPRGLAAREYGRQLAARIKRDHVVDVTAHGEPPRAQDDIFGKHTTHFSAADDEENWVAITATVNTTFGSKVVVPGTGVVLNNQMDDFSIQPGVPNYFQLVGNEANAVAAGKRPLSSMSPTVVLKEGKPILSVGAAGGPTIISQTLLAIIETLDFGREPKEALAQPRFHHQWKPDQLKIEKTVPAEVRSELERRGHRLQVIDSFGACQVIGFDSKAGKLTGSADPRLNGKAAGN